MGKRKDELKKPYKVEDEKPLRFLFSTFDEMEEFGKNWSFFCRYRFGVHKFLGRFEICQHQNFQAARAYYNDGMMYSGFAPEGCVTLVLCAVQKGSLTANRLIMHEKEILIIDDAKEYDVVFNDTTQFDVLSVKKEIVMQSHPYLLEMIDEVYVDSDSVLGKFFETVFENDNGGSRSERDCSDDAMLQKILHMLDDLDLSSKEAVPKRLTKKEMLLFEIREYIFENLQFDLSISELSRRFGISERALQYGFRKVFGLTPKRFIKILCLNEAHKEILRAKGKIKISEVAVKWGFENY